jgi:hypothetical protein
MYLILHQGCSVLIVLGEGHAQTRVDGTKDNGVGYDLHNVGLAWRQGQQHARRQQNKQNDGDKNVQIHVLYITI